MKGIQGAHYGFFRKFRRDVLKASFCSIFERWRAEGKITNFELDIRSWMASEAETGVPGSSSPTMMRVGILILDSRFK
jgi:hypothetical protein